MSQNFNSRSELSFEDWFQGEVKGEAVLCPFNEAIDGDGLRESIDAQIIEEVRQKARAEEQRNGVPPGMPQLDEKSKAWRWMLDVVSKVETGPLDEQLDEYLCTMSGEDQTSAHGDEPWVLEELHKALSPQFLPVDETYPAPWGPSLSEEDRSGLALSEEESKEAMRKLYSGPFAWNRLAGFPDKTFTRKEWSAPRLSRVIPYQETDHAVCPYCLEKDHGEYAAQMRLLFSPLWSRECQKFTNRVILPLT